MNRTQFGRSYSTVLYKNNGGETRVEAETMNSAARLDTGLRDRIVVWRKGNALPGDGTDGARFVMQSIFICRQLSIQRRFGHILHLERAQPTLSVETDALCRKEQMRSIRRTNTYSSNRLLMLVDLPQGPWTFEHFQVSLVVVFREIPASQQTTSRRGGHRETSLDSHRRTSNEEVSFPQRHTDMPMKKHTNSNLGLRLPGHTGSHVILLQCQGSSVSRMYFPLTAKKSKIQREQVRTLRIDAKSC